MRPKVSIIIPIYNTEKYLKRCLNSVMEQTLEDIEVIMVNDGSTDNSLEICNDYCALDKKFKVINKENQGLGFARNSGLEIANGEYCAFLDSDDYINRDMYNSLYIIAKNCNADACLCGFYRHTYRGKIIECFHPLKGKVLLRNEIYSELYLNLLGSLPEYNDDVYVNASSCFGVYSLDFIKSNCLKFYSEKQYVSEDLIFNLQFMEKARVISVSDKCLYTYCENQNSLTLIFKPNRYFQEVIFFNKIHKFIEHCGSNDEINLRLSRSFLGRVRQIIIAEVRNKSFFKAKAAIKKISKEEYFNEILNSYPIKKLPQKHYLFFQLVKYRQLYFIIIGIKLHYWIRGLKYVNGK